jgi:hypothetical protein
MCQQLYFVLGFWANLNHNLNDRLNNSKRLVSNISVLFVPCSEKACSDCFRTKGCVPRLEGLDCLRWMTSLYLLMQVKFVVGSGNPI